MPLFITDIYMYYNTAPINIWRSASVFISSVRTYDIQTIKRKNRPTKQSNNEEERFTQNKTGIYNHLTKQLAGKWQQQKNSSINEWKNGVIFICQMHKMRERKTTTPAFSIWKSWMRNGPAVWTWKQTRERHHCNK